MTLREMPVEEAKSEVLLTVNGESQNVSVDPRATLATVLRRDLALTGTHISCEVGVCGVCTVLLDGLPVRSCLVLAVQAEGRSVRTVEDLADGETLSDLQQAFREAHGLQCGFCTPGFLMLLTPYLDELDGRIPGEDEIRDVVSSNLCRCTGYQGIVDAVGIAAERRCRRDAGIP
jgi:aerobic-type carbon monoxide dehydrogenase small subunit (CoxS/CutS family)